MAERVVIVTGAPGAGKTTILGEAKGSHKVMNIGDLMLEIAKRENFTKKREGLRAKSADSHYASIRDEAFLEVNDQKGDVIVDTHASIEDEGTGRYVPGLPKDALMLIKNLVGFIYIDSYAEDILERRKVDPERKRKEEDPILINDQRMYNISILSTYSTSLNIPLYIILNKQGKLDESVKRIEADLKELFGAK